MAEISQSPLDQIWVHEQGVTPRPYGEATTYHMAYDFLQDCASVEDWGCAYAYGRTFFPDGVYRGVDGSKWAAPYADAIEDLRSYRADPKPEGIVMRHVLEHNWAWRDILDNAMASFTRKFCLIIFTPFSHATTMLTSSYPNTPDLTFRKEDLTGYFKGLTWRDEALHTNTQFQGETVFFVERKEAE